MALFGGSLLNKKRHSNSDNYLAFARLSADNYETIFKWARLLIDWCVYVFSCWWGLNVGCCCNYIRNVNITVEVVTNLVACVCWEKIFPSLVVGKLVSYSLHDGLMCEMYLDLSSTTHILELPIHKLNKLLQYYNYYTFIHISTNYNFNLNFFFYYYQL